MAKKKSTSTWGILIGIVGTALAIAAIMQQLRLPADERTWYGSILGIPYDFRLPTPERIEEKIWNKNTSRIIMPHIFGVGWSINFYPLVHMIRERL
jgi:uncharacterized membrane protein